jgi:hypothetical protein
MSEKVDGEVRVGRRVWVRDFGDTNGRSLGRIASLLPKLLADAPPAFVIRLDSTNAVMTCAENRRGELWDFAD